MNRNELQTDILAVAIPEAARRLGVSARTVATLIKAKVLPSRRIGRRRLIRVSDLENFLRHDHATQVAPERAGK